MTEDEIVAFSEESLDKEQILSQHDIRAITPPVPEEVEDDESRPDESTLFARSSTITSRPAVRQTWTVGSTPWHDPPQISRLPTGLPSTSLRPWSL